MATAGTDAVADVWDATSGELLLAFTSPQPINSASFSPDGRQLVVAGDDHTARVGPIERDARPLTEITTFVRCHSPFVLDGARTVGTRIDRAACYASRNEK